MSSNQKKASLVVKSNIQAGLKIPHGEFRKTKVYDPIRQNLIIPRG